MLVEHSHFLFLLCPVHLLWAAHQIDGIRFPHLQYIINNPLDVDKLLFLAISQECLHYTFILNLEPVGITCQG